MWHRLIRRGYRVGGRRSLDLVYGVAFFELWRRGNPCPVCWGTVRLSDVVVVVEPMLHYEMY